MTFPTDWDIEKYHVEHESDEHWELRRRFLEEHKDKYPEDRLVCLAQVFYNVEFMGCRYPEKTMQLVAQLSEGVADDHREKMKTKLQRTFVQASDAASSKVKGHSSRKEDTAHTKQNKHTAINFEKASEENSLSQQNYDHIDPSAKKPSSSADPSPQEKIPGRFVYADQSRFEQPQKSKKKRQKKKQAEPLDTAPKKLKPSDDVFSRLVLMESAGMNPYGILSRSTGASHMQLKQECKKLESGHEVAISIDGQVLALGQGANVEEAKKLCAVQGLAKLKKLCYTLIIKDRLAGSVVDKSEISPSEGKLKTNNEIPEHLAEDSKANKMMKLMGWVGGGLGKNQQGRQEPVQVVEQVKRAGLGRQEEGGPAFKKNMIDLLQKYRNKNSNHDLVFASDFSKEERKTIHNIASRFGLKSVSYGKDADRQLVISIKKTPLQIVEDVKQAGGSTDKYDLVPPEHN